ncbi:MAG TPA: Rrf2 family transcriptional regulator [Dehalococcoidia bacterium]|jgi:Rrf2 family protein|nr:Rrf2 family transcriptional regulator [Dehalococcoidia bacterium]
MKLTSRGELALKAMLEIAKAEANAEPALPGVEIARRCQASVKFLEQVLTQLRVAGFIVSSRGRIGGYRLARDADSIMVGEIHRLIDGPLAPAPCASVSQHHSCDWCPSETTCELKSVWTRVRDAIAEVMDSTSLGDLVREGALQPIDRYAI